MFAGFWKTYLKLSGWKLVDPPPDLPKYVLIAAPHTTNWDLVYMQAVGYSNRMGVSWMGKHTLFKPPFGPIMRAMGGVPVVRHERRNMVDQIADEFAKRDRFIIAIPPEATRKRAEYWRSGFYHIAKAAGVPVVLGYLDYAKKEAGFGPPLYPSGDIKKDMDIIRAFYAGKVGKYPDQFGPIRLKEEDPSSEEAPRS
ncbi:MAG: lysophospholipid acyltransferase family protein [Myxococcales bacterium]|nr:lysophospholipid acyltransferase family protein [Myxococcales bacterium]